MNPGDLVDIQLFGRAVVVALSGSHVRVKGPDGFEFEVHRRLVQGARVGEKNGHFRPVRLDCKKIQYNQQESDIISGSYRADIKAISDS